MQAPRRSRMLFAPSASPRQRVTRRRSGKAGLLFLYAAATIPGAAGCNPQAILPAVQQVIGLIASLKGANNNSGLANTGSVANSPLTTVSVNPSASTSATAISSNSLTALTNGASSTFVAQPTIGNGSTRLAQNARDILGVSSLSSGSGLPGEDTGSKPVPTTQADINALRKRAYSDYMTAVSREAQAKANFEAHQAECAKPGTPCSQTAITKAEAELRLISEDVADTKAEYDRVRGLRAVS